MFSTGSFWGKCFRGKPFLFVYSRQPRRIYRWWKNNQSKAALCMSVFKGLLLPWMDKHIKACIYSAKMVFALIPIFMVRYPQIDFFGLGNYSFVNFVKVHFLLGLVINQYTNRKYYLWICKLLIHTNRLNGPEPEGLSGVSASNHEGFLLYRPTSFSCSDISLFFVKICRKFNFDKLFNGVHKYPLFLAIFRTSSIYRNESIPQRQL